MDLPSQMDCKRSDTMQTKSLCPECKKVIDATVYRENGQVLLKKTCTEHGTFKDVYWSDAALYERFAEFRHDGTGVDNPMTEREGQWRCRPW